MAHAGKGPSFLYALTSGVLQPGATQDEASLGGIAVQIKDNRSRPLGKYSYAMPAATQAEAAYEAILMALREAHRIGARTVTVYTDDRQVADEVNRAAEVAAANLSRYLECRAAMNQFRRARVKHIDAARNHNTRAMADRAARDREVRAQSYERVELPLGFAEN